MNHEKRIELAEKVLGRLKEKYQENFLVGGVYGSVARCDDDEYSDIDIIVITEKEVDEDEGGFLFQDRPVNHVVKSFDEAERTLSEVNFSWPWAVSQQVDFEVLMGEREVKKELRAKIEDISEERCKETIRKQLPEIHAAFLKAKRNHKKEDHQNLVVVVHDCLNAIAGSLALLNQEYFKRNYFHRARETLDYEKTPDDYQELFEKTTNFKEPEEMFKGLEELFANFLKLLEKEGIETPQRNADNLRHSKEKY
ncbi:MAG: nucleotidyltransferase domain-containing protein [Candidatus Thermoplasmatota archaeon]